MECTEHGKLREDIHTIKNSLNNILGLTSILSDSNVKILEEIKELNTITYRNGDNREHTMKRADFNQMVYDDSKKHTEFVECLEDKLETFDTINKIVFEMKEEKDYKHKFGLNWKEHWKQIGIMIAVLSGLTVFLDTIVRNLIK